MELDEFRSASIPAFDFARQAFALADNLTHQEYFRRPAVWIKELVEEVLPIATFAKSWEMPGRRLEVQYFGRSHPFDAIITITGEMVANGATAPRYHLEVTSAIFESEHLEREALARDGAVFGDPAIHREGSRSRGDDKIVNNATLQDTGAPVASQQAWIESAIAGKSGLHYPDPCLLLVRAQPVRPLALSEWCAIAEKVSPAALAAQFADVFVVDPFTATVHRFS
jgi:hypothetical protein